MSLLSLRDIAKSFGAIEALRGVDLEINPGEVVGLMGDNGAGKSTLVKIIAGNFPQTSGSIEMEGQPVHFHRPIDAREVGIEVARYMDAIAGLAPEPFNFRAGLRIQQLVETIHT